MIQDRGRAALATLVIPVRNAGPSLEANLQTVAAWLAARPEAWELILVDDCSSDSTPDVVERFAQRHEGGAISRIRFTENRGKGFALRTGLGLARGTYVLFTDCDLAYPIDNAGKVLARLESGADASIACRVLPQSLFSYLSTRHLVGRLFNLVLALPRLLDTQAGLKGFRTEALRRVLPRLSIDGFSFDVELLRALMDQRADIREIPVVFRYDSEPSTVRFAWDSMIMMRDLVLIRLRSARGVYRRACSGTGVAHLVVRADDYGLSPGVNQAIQQGLEAGFLTGTSIMMGSPHSEEALRWASSHPAFRFGVHLNLTLGRPLLAATEVPSLVTRAGAFRSLPRFLLRFFTGRVRSREVRAEWRAQIAAIRRRGIAVTHLDSHQHVHLLPRFCSRITVPLAREFGVEVRTMDGPVRGGGLRLDLKGWLLWLASRSARRAGIGTYASVRGAGTALMHRPTLAVLQSLLGRMKPGRTYELVVHPGLVDMALKATGDPYLDGRERERALLASDEYRAVLRHAGVELKQPEQADSGMKAGR